MRAVTELIWTGSYGSTTIDQICERAKVNKGSFYYFFDSKAALAIEAVEAGWEEYRQKLDRLFSSSVPPLERIHRYCRFECEDQAALKERYGAVLGCPMCTLGAEISTLEATLCHKVNEVMEKNRKYFETAIRDAHAEGSVFAPDAAAAARRVYVYVEGLLTQARIKNDLQMLKEMEGGILAILGVAKGKSKAAA